MRRREVYWSLYQTVERRQLDDLRTDQVEAVFSALSEPHKGDWAIWREGYRSWKPFTDFPKLVQELRNVSAAPVPVPEVPPAPIVASKVNEAPKNATPIAAVKPKTELPKSEVTEPSLNTEVEEEQTRDFVTRISPSGHRSFDLDDISDVKLTVNKIGNNDGRDHVRFPKRFEVRIHVGTRVYPNITVDISMGGMRLKDPLPKNLPQLFTVELKAADHVIPLVCTEVKTDGPANRLLIQEGDYMNHLKTVLLSVG